MSGRETPKGRCMNLLPPKRWEDRDAWTRAHPIRAWTLFATLMWPPFTALGFLAGAPVSVVGAQVAMWYVLAWTVGITSTLRQKDPDSK